MRPVLGIIGIAILAIIISVIVVPPGKKDLTSNVQEREDLKRKDSYQPTADTKKGKEGLPMADLFDPPLEGTIKATITVQGRGDIGIELYPKAAPQTVSHIVELINGRFYDGIKVHRVEPGFVVQAGDPETKAKGVDAPGIGSHGSGKNVPFEKNKLGNVTGSIAMALSAPASATGDSQWFINLTNNHPLDEKYCVFGMVKSGLDKVALIKKGDVIEKIVVLK
jgi:cyclophilin family peptidyl-prolyl cis-trans isomerase